MQISPTMNLSDLAERMGTDASMGEAHVMRSILCDGPYLDTNEIPDRVWVRMVAEAIDALPCE